MRSGVAAALASAFLLVLGAAPGVAQEVPLPERLADTGGGTQLIVAEAPTAVATTGTLTWWERRKGRWARAGSAPARFGANGLVEGASRRQGTETTPMGVYDLPYAFGIEAAPRGTKAPYRRVGAQSWWCQDDRSVFYNRWTEPLAVDCRASESERLGSYRTQYAYGLVIGFNYRKPVRGRGAGIFLHVDGKGATAGCVSVPRAAMRSILTWVDPVRRPHIAIRTVGAP
jgi:L,D-peptidoglycan transpeptidase YkuD (ErfK/YbiS/YcfS/YnhG family)